MTLLAPSLSLRQRKLLRRGGIALLIYVLAVLAIVPWENVGLMLLVPGYPLALGLLAFGLAHLSQSRIGRWLSVLWGSAGAGLMFVYWIRHRSLISDPMAYFEWSRRITPVALWIWSTYILVGLGLALWGWVIYIRAYRLARLDTSRSR
jgi:hypothetical protein